jgi:hypothetical protein
MVQIRHENSKRQNSGNENLTAPFVLHPSIRTWNDLPWQATAVKFKKIMEW